MRRLLVVEDDQSIRESLMDFFANRSYLVEGVEDAAMRFCIGVEWHPEFEISDGDRRILEAFVAAARES